MAVYPPYVGFYYGQEIVEQMWKDGLINLLLEEKVSAQQTDEVGKVIIDP